MIYLATIFAKKLENSLNNQNLIIEEILSNNEERSYKKYEVNENEKENILTKIKSKIIEWLSSPYFILHICRLCLIIIILKYASCINTLLFIWYLIL